MENLTNPILPVGRVGSISRKVVVKITTVDILTTNGTDQKVRIQPHALLPPPGTTIMMVRTTITQAGTTTIPLAGARRTVVKLRHHLLLP